MYRDFGVGQMGDMGAHTMDLAWNVVDAGAPTAIDIDFEVSDKYNPEICPVKLKATFEHPANSWRGPVTVVWYQGGLKPNPPRGYIDLTRVGNGTKIVFTGDPYQIDNPYVDSSSNGFNYVVSRFRAEAISAHVELQKGERSELAELAANIL